MVLHLFKLSIMGKNVLVRDENINIFYRNYAVSSFQIKIWYFYIDFELNSFKNDHVVNFSMPIFFSIFFMKCNAQTLIKNMFVHHINVC